MAAGDEGIRQSSLCEVAEDMLAQSEKTMTKKLTILAAEVCRREDALAHADFYGEHRRDSAQHAEKSETPWRGLMPPATRRLLEFLERRNAYVTELNERNRNY